MRKWRFRIVFTSASGDRFRNDDGPLTIDLAEEEVSCVLASGEMDPKLANVNRFAMISGDFDSEERATEAGKRLRIAVMLSGARLKMGLRVGDEVPSATVSRYMRDEPDRGNGPRMVDSTDCIDGAPGVWVYPTDVKTTFVSFPEPRIIRTQPASRLIDALRSAYEMGPTLDASDKLTLGLELYSAFHFEQSPRARFLTLVTAVEAVCRRKRHPEPILRCVEVLIEKTKSFELDDANRATLVQRLNGLVSVSISQSIRDEVRARLGDEKAELMKQCYNERSRIVHDGKPGVRWEKLKSLTVDLDSLVSELLLAMLGESSKEGA